MSSLDNEPEALTDTLQECLTAVLTANGRERDEVKLERFNEEAFIRQTGRIPGLLAELVEEASNGTYTVRHANSAIAHGKTALNGELYFVRCLAGVQDEEVTHPTDDMVLFVINRHTKRLFVNVPMQSQEHIDAELARREEERLALREAERIRAQNAATRRIETEAELAQLISAIEWYVQTSESKEARDKWGRMNARSSQYHGVITLPDLLELCHLLGINLATLVVLSPATAKASR
jgi:hypothetical protein